MEFEFRLAEKLGMTVGRLRAEMSQEEFTQWLVFWQRRAQRAELARKAGKG